LHRAKRRRSYVPKSENYAVAGAVTLLLTVAFSPLEAQSSPLFCDADWGHIRSVCGIFAEGQKPQQPFLTAFVWFSRAHRQRCQTALSADTSGGKYPLIIYSHGGNAAVTEAADMIKELVSKGFVIAGVNHYDTTDKWQAFINRPLDVLFY